MPVTIPILSESDLRVLKMIVRDYENQNRGRGVEKSKPNRSDTTNPVYTAALPQQGIPAQSGGVPGAAECAIVRLNYVTGQLEGTGNVVVVLNLSASPVNSEFCLVTRDAYGAMWVLGSGGSGSGVVRFTITGAGNDDSSMMATLDANPCNSDNSEDSTGTGTGTGTLTPTEVEIFDAAGCFFNESTAALIGRIGYASQLKESNGDCRWEVFSLCCP